MCPQATVVWAEAALELTDSEVATAVAVGRETVRRWRQRTGIPSSTHRRGLEQLNQLRHRLESEFDSTTEALAWMHSPLAGFGGQTPLSLVTNGDIDAVIAVLDSTAAGAFV